MRNGKRFVKAVFKRRAPGEMTKYEAAYEAHLQSVGANYRYEPVKFRLTDRSTYTPDFMIVADDGTIDFHEVKAGSYTKLGLPRPWCEPDAKLKVQFAAEQYPEFRFSIVYYDRRAQQWRIEEQS